MPHETTAMSITYRKGDALMVPTRNAPQFLVHVCNDVKAWGAGFTKALSQQFPKPEQYFRGWAGRGATGNGKPYALGQIQFVKVREDGGGVWVVNMVAQKGIGGSAPNIRYRALRTCLEQVAEQALKMNPQAIVRMPRIGCGLAGGKWESVEKHIQAALCDKGVMVEVIDL